MTNDDHCPNMFHHVWVRDEWPLPTHPYCTWCGRPQPADVTSPVRTIRI